MKEMAIGNKKAPDLDLIQELFNVGTKEYHEIRRIAQEDLGQKLIDRIDEFLNAKTETKVEELKKIVFEDASKVTEDDVDDIVDAFVKMRDVTTLDSIDKKSIEDILILFNQWIMIGKGQQENLPRVSFESNETQRRLISNLEEQLSSVVGTPRNMPLYQSFASMQSMSRVYSPGTLQDYLPSDLNVQFLTREDRFDNQQNAYFRIAEYKSH